MSSLPFSYPAFSVAAPMRGRGRSNLLVGCHIGQQPLATDSIGNAVVTFSGVKSGSEIRVYLPDQTEAAGVETCAADQVLTWGAYAPGSANNVVRVVIVHPSYRIKEFTYTAYVGAQTLPVQQELDKWYSNP